MATTQQKAAASALAAEFGPAIVWTETTDMPGLVLIYTDTTPTLAFLVSAAGAVSSPRNGRCEEDWCREAWEFDSPRVMQAARAVVEAASRVPAVRFR